MIEMEDILKVKIEEFKLKSFEELKELMSHEDGPTHSYEVKDGDDSYQIEVTIEWEDKDLQLIRVVGFIDADHPKHWWQRFVSSTSDSFFVTPQGVQT